MRKTIATIITLALGAGTILAQSFNAQTVTNIVVPPVHWSGSNATVIAGQLLSVTNCDGSAVVPANFFSGRSATVTLRIINTTNGLQSITATVR
jgi:hypothetical protein